MWHVCYRGECPRLCVSLSQTAALTPLVHDTHNRTYSEFYSEAYEPFIDKRDAKSAAMMLMEKSLAGISEMVAGWIRVGFVQGNLNWTRIT